MKRARSVYGVAEVRAIERAALAAAPAGTLMRRAGAAAAGLAMRLLPGGGRVLAIAGPGNNGGDAMEAATLLASQGWQVTIDFRGNPAALSADAADALRRAKASSARFDQADMAQGWDLALDGLFGIGLARPIAGDLAELVRTVNRLPCPVVALDVPSGLDADTGAIVGPDGVAVQATHTLTFIADKPGLHTADGCDHAGLVEVASLDIDTALFPAPSAWLAGTDLFAPSLQPRRQNSHKGSFGDVAILGGAQGMSGAAILAARTAALAGAGRVFAGFLAEPPAYDPPHPEIMCRRAADLELERACVVAGPGLGSSGQARSLLSQVLAGTAPLVLDADALNMVAAGVDLRNALGRRGGALLTPHPLEAARLLGCTAAQVQADRLAAARRLAADFGAVVVLKGAGSVIARPDGLAVINVTGSPALATAGTGDVLAGLCGALLAQRWPAWEAALAAVWLHGAAADMLVDQGVGPVGLVASELPGAVRTCLNQLIRAAADH
ncbi:NAD(P)H-hydrate dehydratase|uniref:NAD(P)H-hydrate dehydratase n=1 Tax=Noviherbaspirillum sp. L7-7A TaxID=2850560 RepID=UPI001C2C6A5F|nr:NAD(P)H-hydrate dehydratase [Noviherbaspirillum sp. L7-7A]MBV0878906.1 NAD(P)H-hydrate dehydratase [Noviherbaspirillum sp. L7-7A]